MSSINISSVVDDARFNRFHAKVLAWCLLIIIIDGYDVFIAGAALPSIMKDMAVDAQTAGLMASSALFGMMFGAMFFGALSDRIGRRWTVAICVALFSAFTLAAGYTHEPTAFIVLRFVAGLGIGGVMPNIVAQMTEYSPRRIRSFMTTVMFSGYAMGGMLAAIVGKNFIVDYGWQVLFIVAGVPLLVLPFILKTMPESLSFVIAHKKSDQLRHILAQLAPGVDPARVTTDVPQTTRNAAGATVADLFRNGRGVSTVMFWIAFFTGLFMVYALSSWLTKLMAMSGYNLGSALSFLIALNLGAMIGAIGGGWLADRFHIKWVLVCMYALGSVFLYMMTFRMSTEMRYLVAGAVGACTTGAQIVTYAYSGQFYPSAMRSTGVGMAAGVGRIGAIAGPLLIGLIVSLQLPMERNFMLIGSAGIIGALALACIKHSKSACVISDNAAASVRPTHQNGLANARS